MAGMFQDGQRWYRHERAKRCSGKGQVPAEPLEQQVLDRLNAFQMPDALKDRIKTLARQMAKQQARPAWQEAEQKVRATARKLENLKELRIEGDIGKAEYDRRKKEYAQELARWQAQLRAAPGGARDIEELLTKIDQVATVICEGSPEKRKQLFQTLFEQLEQSDGRLTRVVPRAWARPLFVVE
jgi:hypothetical protein